MSERGEPVPTWLKSEARHVFGTDPENYDAGRPEYPARVYELLTGRCGLTSGAQLLEIGPGSGPVTRRLLDLGAEVTAVEPDPELARYLTTVTEGRPVSVIGATFEGAALPVDSYDVVVAAMSFHWVDLDIGLPKLGQVLRPGGWAALWWTVFGDPVRPDPFRDATTELLEANGAEFRLRQPQFELDVDKWTRALSERAGLVDVDAELVRWTIRLDPDAVRALHATRILVRRLPPETREPLLDALRDIAADDFGGVVERPFVTSIYTARRPL